MDVNLGPLRVSVASVSVLEVAAVVGTVGIAAISGQGWSGRRCGDNQSLSSGQTMFAESEDEIG